MATGARATRRRIKPIDLTHLGSPKSVEPCSKCGSDAGWDGPTYVSDECTEWLLYYCHTCGYSRQQPTKDADLYYKAEVVTSARGWLWWWPF